MAPHRDSRIIHLHAEAPAKPAPGQPCNGCGACCALEPCPLGMLVSGRRQGRCRALRWDAEALRYRCGLMAGAGGWRAALVARWIGAGQGCDATFDVSGASPMGKPPCQPLGD